MKTKSRSKPAGKRIRLLEIAVLALPFLALTPNFFIIPDLSYQGNATQELVLAWTLVIFLGIALVAIIMSRDPIAPGREQITLLAPLSLFIIWQLITLAWVPYWAEAVRVSSLWLFFLVFFATCLFLLRPQSAAWLYYSMTAVVLILAGSQFVEYWQYKGEMLGVFFSHGVTTELLALMLPLQLAVYLTTKRRLLAVVAVIAAGAAAIALLLTLRRGALLGTAVAILLIVVAMARGWLRIADRWRLILAGGAILVLLVGVFAFKRQEILSRLRSAVRIETSRSATVSDLGLTSRLSMWLTAWEMGKRHPVLGVGNGGFPSQYGEYRRYFVQNPSFARVAEASEAEDFDEVRAPHAHNEYLQIFDELGLLGLLLFAAFWVRVIWILFRARRSTESAFVIGALAGLLAFAVSSAMSAFSFRYSPGTIMSACVAGLGCALALAAAPRPESGDGSPTAARVIPKPAVVAVLAALLLVGALLIVRNRNVLNSQQAQSQIDFRISLDSPALNEGLLRRYQQALILDETNSGAHLGLGLLLFQMKRPAEAAPHVEYALHYGYGRPYAYLLLAFALEQMGDIDRATNVLADCLASFPKSLATRAAYAELLQKQGKTDAAAAERAMLDRLDTRAGRSWQIALRAKDAPATMEARAQGLIPPNELEPRLVRVLVQARAYHYLK
jgi:O-antigen ligase